MALVFISWGVPARSAAAQDARQPDTEIEGAAPRQPTMWSCPMRGNRPMPNCPMLRSRRDGTEPVNPETSHQRRLNNPHRMVNCPMMGNRGVMKHCPMLKTADKAGGQEHRS